MSEITPASLIAGDSMVLRLFSAREIYAPADGWAVGFVMTPLSGGAATSIIASDGGDAWVITLTPAASAALAAGPYGWAIRATSATMRETLASGQMTVLPDPAVPNVDRRSHAQRALAAIEATIEGRATSADLEYVFEDGRAIKMMGHDELLKLRRYYRQEVVREARASSGTSAARIRVRL